MFKSIALLIATVIITSVSIYTLSVPAINGGSINFADYQNKKIFIVNTATGSNGAAQIAELQQLYLQHQDSLVVIAFPSNSFGHEPANNASIESIMQNTYGATFPIAAKSVVKGDTANSVYKWLADKLQNGRVNGKARTDFYKFLIDKQGLVVGVFDSSVSPLSNKVQQAIQNN